MQAEEILLAAVQKPTPAERAAYLDGACGADAALRAVLEGLLKSHEEAGSFLEQPLFEPAPTRDHSAHLERPGTVIGPYKLLQQIGEGGMGVVFMAEQLQPVQRKVALKIIKPGMDSKQVIARLEAERQALALMDHPHIAKVLDAGTTDADRPYFVMELVKGLPITKYCDDHHLTCKERLELFVPVCRAVQHAHQKGIIHRDLKPSNVMVCLYDGRPVPKVIDFGVAKATGQKLTERTMFTEFGQVVGTLEYMSPEQATLSQLDIDTRSDIYSLGVLLYELLAGSTPLDRNRFKEGALLESLRLIREEEPQKPSTRLSSTEELPAIAANRGLEPRKLSGLLRGELDWIVMKCLEKDRNRRYETANGLAMDVQRYLRDEQVHACPPSAWYRFRKIARRNKVALMTAALVVLALVVGTVVSAWQAIRATQAEGLAETRLEGEKAARTDADGARLHAETDRDRAKRRLYDARLAQAKASRLSRRVGQRFESLKALEEAAKIAQEMGLAEEDFLELRNEAIACLALPDLRVAKEWDGWPAGSFNVIFDEELERYAREDRKGNVSIRRVRDDAEIYRVQTDLGAAWLSLSADGRFLAARGGDRIKLWRLVGAKPEPIRQEAACLNCAFSPNSRLFAVGYADGSISLFDLASGELQRRLAAGPWPWHLAFHPKGRQLAVASPTSLQIRDLETGKAHAEFRYPRVDYPYVAWHPDGKTVAAIGGDRIIYLWDVPTGKQTIKLEGFKNGGINFAFSRGGDRLVSQGWESMLRLWDPRTGQQLFQTQATGIHCTFGPEDRLLAADIDRVSQKLRLWEVAAGREYRTLVRDPVLGPVDYSRVQVSPDGRMIAVGTPEGLGLWSMRTGDPLVFARTGAVDAVLFEPSGTLLTSGPSGLFRWPCQPDPAATGLLRIGPPQRLPVPASVWSEIALSADGQVLASAQPWGGLVLHLDHPDQPIRLTPHGDARFIAVSPDGRWVATGSHSGTAAKVWEARTGKLVQVLLPTEGLVSVTFSPDGKWLATSGRGYRLWAVGSWQESVRIGGDGTQTFSPDGNMLAVETGVGVVRLLHPETGREYARLEDPNQDRTRGFAFSPDGTKLLATSGDSRAFHVWDLRAIREELARLGLDWDLPPYPPADETKAARSLTVSLDAGILVPEQPQAALVGYSLAITLQPINPEAYRRRGSAYYSLGRWREAADDLSLTLRLGPAGTDPALWSMTGKAHSNLREWDKAVAAYSNAMKLGLRDGPIWSERGTAYGMLAQYESAAADFARAIEAKPDDPVLWYCQAMAKLGANDVDGYHQAWARMRERFGKTKDPVAAGWMVLTCDVIVKPGSGTAELVSWSKLAASHLDWTRLLGHALYRDGQYEAAVRHLQQWAKTKPLRGDDLFFLAMAQHQLGKEDNARATLGQAVTWIADNERFAAAGGLWYWNEQVEVRYLRREAEKLLQRK